MLTAGITFRRTKLNLYDLSANYRAAFAHMREMGLDDQTINDTLEGMEGELEDKIRNCMAYALNLEAEAAAVAEAKRKMEEREAALLKRANWMREYVKNNMLVLGRNAYSCPEFEIKIQKNPGSVLVTDESLLPPELIRTIPEKVIPASTAPDKKAIGDALKAGVPVPGAELQVSYKLIVK